MTSLLERPGPDSGSPSRDDPASVRRNAHVVDPDAAHRDAATEQPSRRGIHRRRLSRAAWTDLVTVGLIVTSAIAMVTTNVTGAPAYQDDEGTYTAQAMSADSGSLAPYTYWYDHPPFGWIQLAVLGAITRMLGIGDGTDIGSTRFTMAIYFAATAALIYLLARRLEARPVFGLVASAIFILSPLSLSNGRQVYLDSITLPWLLLAFYLATTPKVALWSHAGAGGAFAIAVLSKLTAAVLGPALLVALIDRKRWSARPFSVVGFLAVGALVLCFFPLMALLRGELLSGPGHVSLQDGLLYQFASRAGSGYLWEAGSGRFTLVASWFDGDGFLLAMGLVGALVCVASRRTRWILVAVVSFFVPVVLGQGYLPAMYIVGGIPFLCLAVGVGVDLVWRGAMRFARKRLPGARFSAPLLSALALGLVLLPIPVQSWAEKDSVLLTANQNADWRSALGWLRENVPKSDTVLVPYSMWQDANSSGWNDPWTMIALEKVDLDSSFATEHPAGWRDIQWIVEGPTVEPNIRYLGLKVAGTAYDHSSVVTSFGPWKIRRVDSGTTTP